MNTELSGNSNVETVNPQMSDGSLDGEPIIYRFTQFLDDKDYPRKRKLITSVAGKEVLRDNNVKSSSRNLDLPPVIQGTDVAMFCITLDDVEEFCKDEGVSLTDEEMELVFYILNDNWRWDMIGEAIQRLRNDDHSFVAGCG